MAKLIVKGVLTLVAALVVAFVANWLLARWGIDPFGIREISW